MGCDIHLHVEAKTPDGWTLVLSPTDFRNFDRSYYVFGILAGVRRTDLTPIAAQKGIPPDVSPECFKLFRDYGDGHTPSWLYLNEIMSFDWSKTVKRSGYMDHRQLSDYLEFGRHGIGHVYANEHPQAEVIPRDALERMIETSTREPGVCCHVEWEVPYTDLVSGLLCDILPKLFGLGVTYGLANVRLVFWFDN